MACAASRCSGKRVPNRLCVQALLCPRHRDICKPSTPELKLEHSNHHDPTGRTGVIRGYIGLIWVVVKIMVPFWVPIIIQRLIFRVPKKGP